VPATATHHLDTPPNKRCTLADDQGGWLKAQVGEPLGFAGPIDAHVTERVILALAGPGLDARLAQQRRRV